MIQILNTMACNDSGLLHAFLIIKNVINLIKVGIPIVLIIMGMLDMLKAVISSDEKSMKESQNSFIKRIIAAVVIFLIPVIVDFCFTSLAKLELEYTDCWTAATKENVEKLKIEEEKAREAEREEREKKEQEEKEDESIEEEEVDNVTKLRKEVVAEALKYSITPSHPYVYGGNTLCSNWINKDGCGVDCSSFVQLIYKKFHFNIPRTSGEQSRYSGGEKITIDEDDYSNLKPGDLIFYKKGGTINHVSMYTGDGYVVHASSPSVGVIISKMSYRTPAWAIRIIK